MSKLGEYRDFITVLADMHARSAEINEIKVSDGGMHGDSSIKVLITLTKRTKEGRYGAMSRAHRHFIPKAIEDMIPEILSRATELAGKHLTQLKAEAKEEVMEFITNEMEVS